MWVKICGNTNLEDAARAANLGADAIGFVFAPSKRQVTPEQVAGITPHLPSSVERIGVFTTSSAGEIASAAEVAHLTAIQLHGPFDQRKIGRLLQLLPDLAIIPVVHWDVSNTAAAQRAVIAELDELSRTALFRRVLIDTKIGAASGGTGVSFDWDAARPVFQQQLERGVQAILAGGLRPHTVAEAIRVAQPWGVDVSSGVESAPGRKDPAALAEFIAQARRVSDPHLSRAESK